LPYFRPLPFFEELFFAELFFAELFFADDFFDEACFVDFFEAALWPLFLAADFFVEALRPTDFFLLAFFVAIWVLPPVKLERSCFNFVAWRDLRSSRLSLLRDWSVRLDHVWRRRRISPISKPVPAKAMLVIVQ
jgi:hypothetical protein